MRRTSRFLALFLFAPLSTLFAQAPEPLSAGQRIRITAPSLGINKFPATFEAWRGDTLFVVANSRVSCPRVALSRLEVSQGRKSNALKGLRTGFIVGAPFGAFFGLLLSNPSYDAPGCYEGAGVCAAAGALWIGAVGGLVGLGIGALSTSERWEEVPLHRVRPQVITQRNGFGLVLTVQF